MEYIIEAKNLAVSLEGNHILHDLSCAVPSGSIYALLGPNGAGKTTLIRTIVNIYQPRRGSLNVLGVPSKRIEGELFEQIGYVSENQDIPKWMSIDAFLKYCSRFYSAWDHGWVDKKVMEFKLPRNQTIQSISRGMQIKVVLISALAFRPKLLILDEPFSGLDPVVREQFIKETIDLVADMGMTVFLSSHDLQEVEEIANYIGFMSAGEIDLEQDIDTLLQNTRRVRIGHHGLRSSSAARTQKNWTSFKDGEGIATFVHTAFDEERVKSEIETVFHGGSILSIESISLKEIFKAKYE